MVGDFNYPDIDWSSWTTTGDSTETDEYRFIEALRDGFQAYNANMIYNIYMEHHVGPCIA